MTKPVWVVLLAVTAVLPLSGCESFCGGTRGVFCPETSENPLNDAPVIYGEIAAFAYLPGAAELEFAPDRGYARGPAATHFVLDHPAQDCSAPPPAARMQACPVVLEDPDGDDLLLEWDLDGDGTYETGQLARADAADPRSPLYEPQSRAEGVRAFYSQAGRVEVRLRVSDFPRHLGAPGALTRTKVISIHPWPVEADRDSNSPPTARFAVSPDPAYAGEPVVLDAAETYDPENHELFYRWELGDGTVVPHDPARPRLHRGDLRTITHTYGSPGSYTVTVSVWDAFVTEGVASQVVRVFDRAGENTPPTAGFSVTPSSPFVGQSVVFDASSSQDREGPIARYEWDLDGDGTFEVDRGPEPTVSTSYGSPGERFVRLQVTDSEGVKATAGRTVLVRSQAPAERPAALSAQATGRRLPFAAALRGRALGRRRAAGGLAVIGAGSLRTRLLAPPGRESRAERSLRRFLRAPWRTRASIRGDRRTGRWRARGVALAQGGRGRGSRRPAACLRFRLDQVRGSHARGSLTVLGGTGDAARLRGSASFRFRLERNGSATVLGLLRARNGPPRVLPAACRTLTRRTR